MASGNTPAGGNPRIRIIPPFLYLGFLAVGGVAEWLLPVVDFPLAPRLGAGITLALLGVLIVPSAMWCFRRAKTPFDVRKAAENLVTEGPFRFSRNPGYLALTLFYAGIGLMAGSIWIVALLIPVLAIMQRAVILREEAHLEETFGEEYLRYKAGVRRWF